MSGHFIGRSAERALFAAALAHSDAAAIFVHGAGGSGKSALLAAFAEDARSAGLDVVHGIDPLGSNRTLFVVDDHPEPSELAATLRRRWDLPADAILVVAGRNPLPANLRFAAGWPAQVEVIELGPLTDSEALEYLKTAGVEDADHAAELSRGNPLALRLLADLAPADIPRDSLVENMPLVRHLIDGIVDPLPSPAHRRALQLSAQVGHTTEDLVTAVLEDNGHELFEWLRRQPYITEADDGLVLDGLVRELIDADLRWRDRLVYADLQRRATAQLFTRMAAHTHDPEAVRRDAFELMILQRHRLAVPQQTDDVGMRSVYLEDDIDLPAIARHVASHGVLRDGDLIGVTILDSSAQLVSAAVSAALASHLDAQLAWDFFVVPDAADHVELLTLLDLHRVATNIYAHDWRRLGPSAWLRKIGDQPWNGPIPPVTGTEGRVLVDRAEFGSAVRTALRDLNYDRRLAANPLVDARIVQDATGELAPEKRLRELIHSAAAELRATDSALFRIIDRVYLRPTATQQQVAETMNLPFTTFRRWRNKAIDQIATLLWEKEVGSDRS